MGCREGRTQFNRFVQIHNTLSPLQSFLLQGSKLTVSLGDLRVSANRLFQQLLCVIKLILCIGICVVQNVDATYTATCAFAGCLSAKSAIVSHCAAPLHRSAEQLFL